MATRSMRSGAPALRQKFVDRGGKYVWIANLDNLGATVDRALLGLFIECGRAVMVEVAEKEKGDRGGIPVHAPTPGGAASCPPGASRSIGCRKGSTPRRFASSTRTRSSFGPTVQGARGQRRVELVRGRKGQVDGKSAVQFERLVQEITTAVDAAYVRVPRHGAAARFLPVKDFDELAARKEDIEAVARSRGML